MKAYRQGDVLIIPTSKKPSSEAKPLEHLVLAEGEATGHKHQITSGSATLYQENGDRLLVVEKEATLTHEEHKPVALPIGNYIIRRQREYDPRGRRPVRD